MGEPTSFENGYRMTDDARARGQTCCSRTLKRFDGDMSATLPAEDDKRSSGPTFFFSRKHTVTRTCCSAPGVEYRRFRSTDACATGRQNRMLRSRPGFRLILWHRHNVGEVLRTPRARRFAFGRKRRKSPFNRLRSRKNVRYALLRRPYENLAAVDRRR